MTPEELVEASSLNGQIDRNTLLDLAYIVLDENHLATPDEFDHHQLYVTGLNLEVEQVQ